MSVRKQSCPNPRCRQQLLIPPEIQGKQVRCAKCGEVFVGRIDFDVAGALARATSAAIADAATSKIH